MHNYCEDRRDMYSEENRPTLSNLALCLSYYGRGTSRGKTLLCYFVGCILKYSVPPLLLLPRMHNGPDFSLSNDFKERSL